MSKNAEIIARINEYNTGGQDRATIDRAHIAMIASHHSRFDGDFGGPCREGYIEEQDGEYVATEKVWTLIPGTSR